MSGTYNEIGYTYNSVGGATYNDLAPAVPVTPPTGLGATPFRPAHTNVGWVFRVVGANTPVTVYFTTTGSYSYDSTRDVSKNISGFQMTPEEAAKVNLGADRIAASLILDGVEFPMGIFRFTESSRQIGVIQSMLGIRSDFLNVTLSDRSTELLRNTGAAHSLLTGLDPSQEMKQICLDAGVPANIAGAVSPLGQSVTWDGSTTELSRLRDLATLAGHRPPWMDNNGILQSVLSQVVQSSILRLEDLTISADTVVITETFLSAPNRVIVSDSSFVSYQIIGQWDAPASAPNSSANIGYVRSVVIDQQGLGGNAHADQVAATIGETLTARKLDCSVAPTNLLDGPTVLSYLGSLWLVTSWSLNTAAGSTLQLTAQELLDV